MTNFNTSNLLRKRQFRYLTGVTSDIFQDMVCRLQPLWEKTCRRKNRSGRPYGVGGLDNHLLVLLILYRCHITQDFLGLLYGVDKATICRSLRRIEPLAHRVLGVKRAIKVTAEEVQALLIDATEQAIERPKHGQKRWYSGKKKRHCIKNEIITTEAGRIVCVSKSVPGTVHDLNLRRQSQPLPETAHAYADSGYQGYQNDHKDIDIPYKSSKRNPLTKDEKEYNHGLSSFRVRVEHAIRRIKIFRTLADRFRYPRPSHAVKFSIAAGISNIVAGF